LRKAVVQAEAEVKRLLQKRDEIDVMLSAGAEGSSASDLMKTRGVVARTLADAERRWLEASEGVEQAVGGAEG